MARKSISIEEKISKQKQVVVQAKDKYEAALGELDALLKKKRDLQSKELINAFHNSNKSLEEILAFINENNHNDC